MTRSRRKQQLEIASHILEVQRGLQYKDLQNYIHKKQSSTKHSYGSAIMEFHNMISTKRQLQKTLEGKKTRSLFDTY